MWYDVVVLAILVFFTARGAIKGVIWQVAGIAGVILCFAFADGISNALGPYVTLQPPLNHWVVLFGGYLFFSFVSFGLARSATKWVEKADMKEYNRHLGGVLGLVKGVMLCTVMTFLIVTVSPDAREALKDSKSGWACAHLMFQLHPILPAKLHDAVGDYIHLLDNDELKQKYAEEGHGHDHDHADDAPLFGGTAPSTDNSWGGTATPWSGNSSGQGSAPTWPSSSSTTTSKPVDSASFWLNVRSAIGEEAKRAIVEKLQQTDPQSSSVLQSQLADIIQKATPQDLAAFSQQVQQSGGSNLPQLLNSWVQAGQSPASSGTVPPVANPYSPPATSTPPASTIPQPPVQTLQAKQELANLIAEKVSDFPVIRKGIVSQINAHLEGVPDSVAIEVLRDWYADITGQADPDPATNRTSTPEQRIIRHLSKVGYPFEQLSRPLQDRLRAAQGSQRVLY
ncbi:MAG: CvpA family protein [Planctomycetaceae bacterium]|nr:CvpA family protein [Planctomycetaceae bacterium]